MKRTALKAAFGIITAILVFIAGIAVNAYAAEINVGQLRREILEYKLNTENAADGQELINDWLAENAGSGSAEWYVLCLSREGGYDFSAYISAIESQIGNSGIKATERQRMAHAYVAAGGRGADIGALIDETWNKLGIMSLSNSLILINSGSYNTSVTDDEIIEDILSRQNENGGWGLGNSPSDADVTALVLQALAPYKSSSEVGSAIERALALLSNIQRDDGGFASYGTPNAESCAQVIIALCQLGIDPMTDARFIKNELTAVDGLVMYKCSSGGYSHLSGGAENGMSTVQAYEAFTALEYGGIYNLKSGEYNPDGGDIIVSPTQPIVDDKPIIVTTAPQNSSGETVVTTTAAVGVTPQIPSNGSDFSQVTEISDVTTTAVSQEGDFTFQTVTAITSGSSVSQTETSAEFQTTTITESYATSTSSTQTSIRIEIADADSSDSESSGINGWKVWAYGGAAGIFAVTQLYTAARKQFSWKRAAVSATACAVFVGAVYLTEIQTPEQYYSRNISDVQPDSMTVTMSVSCEVIADELGGESVIIPPTEFVLLEDESAFDMLERVLAYNKIPFDYNGSTSLDVYVRGIDNIYEMDFGEMSGWMYRINGDFPDGGCGAYKLKDGDVIEWLYTLETGRDIGEEYVE